MLPHAAAVRHPNPEIQEALDVGNDALAFLYLKGVIAAIQYLYGGTLL